MFVMRPTLWMTRVKTAPQQTLDPALSWTGGFEVALIQMLDSSGYVLLVSWVDAFGCPQGWEFEEDVDLDASRVTSIGWKLKENEEFILLCPHRSRPTSGRTQLAGHIVIPKRQIISVREIQI